MMNSGISSCILGITALVLSCMGTSLIGCIDSLLNGDVTKFAVAIVGVILYVYFCIYSGVMNIFNGVKRFHDVGINGWVYLVCMLLSGPGQLAIFIITLLDSKKEVTEYGGVPDESKYKGTKSMLVSSLVFGIGTVFMVVMLFINVMVFGLTGLYEENSSAGVANAGVVESTTEEEMGWGYDEDCISEDIEETEEVESTDNHSYTIQVGTNTIEIEVPEGYELDNECVSNDYVSYTLVRDYNYTLMKFTDTYVKVEQDIVENMKTEDLIDIQGVEINGHKGYIGTKDSGDIKDTDIQCYLDIGESNWFEVCVDSLDEALTQEQVISLIKQCIE
jgi:uncharacterized membrane protein YhaH (DUF805 family)